MTTETKIKNRVSGSVGTFSAVTDTHIFELLPGGIPQTELDSFFVQYERLKEMIPPGTTTTDIIFDKEISGSSVTTLVDNINSLIITPQSQQYLISEGNVIVNGQLPLYPQSDFNNIINILNEEDAKNTSMAVTISGSLSVIKEFEAAMATIQSQFDSFNNTVFGLSKGFGGDERDRNAAEGIMSQTAGASINKSIELAKVFFDSMLKVSTTFLEAPTRNG